MNGVDVTYTNCDGNPASHFALFANNGEVQPTNFWLDHDFPYCDQLFAPLNSNPSGRVMPPDYFTFMEVHFGGCGCYTQTDGRLSIDGVISGAIGFR